MHLSQVRVLAIAGALALTAAAPAPGPAPIQGLVQCRDGGGDARGCGAGLVAHRDADFGGLDPADRRADPEGPDLDSKFVTDEIKGSKALLLPPRGHVGFFEGLWFYTWHMDTLEQPDGTTLEATLPTPLKNRFVAARTRIGKDEDRYGKYLGGVAAIMLESDYWKYAKLTFKEPQETLESIARHAGVPVRETAVYPAMDVVNDIPRMTPAAHLACLDFALKDIDTASAMRRRRRRPGRGATSRASRRTISRHGSMIACSRIPPIAC